MPPSHETHRIAVVDTAWIKTNLSWSAGRRAFGFRLIPYALLFWVLLAAAPARAQTLITTVPANNNMTQALAAAVNMATNNIYVASSAGSNAGAITIINGETNSYVNISDSNATGPSAVAVNPVTNTIYVANSGSGNVTVVDGATAAVTATVGVGTSPIAIAVNPLTNMIYVANSGSNNVTVINGATNATTTVTDSNAQKPQAIALNPVTNRIYVVNSTSGNVTVINGSTSTYVTTVGVGTAPIALAVNPVSNKIYVANEGSYNVSVISGATNTVTTTISGGGQMVAVNPASGQIFTASGNTVDIINGTTDTVATSVTNSGTNAEAMAVNPITNKVYVAFENDSDRLSLIVVDGATYATTTLTDNNALGSFALAINPVTDKIYVAIQSNDNVDVVDGATYATTSVADPTANSAFAVTVNPLTNTAYVANYASNTVTVIAGSPPAYTASVNVGTNPQAILADPLTNTIYVANYTSNNVSVISGATNTVVTTVADPTAIKPYAVAGNPVTNTIYVANQGSNNVSVISAATNTVVATLADPSAIAPNAVAVNPVTNTIYVANFNSSTVSVFAGDTNTLIAALAVGSSPIALVVNPKTNMIYVANSGSNNVSVINGATNTVATVTDSSASYPIAIDVNTLTNTIYVSNNGENGDFPSAVTVINGADNTFTSIDDPYACAPVAVAVNHVSNKTYVVNSCASYPYDDGETAIAVTVIDGATNSASSLGYSLIYDQEVTPSAVAVNPPAGNIYVAEAGSLGTNNATVIAEQQVNTIPITTTVTPLANDQTSSLTPTFTFTATNTLTTAPIDNLLFLEGNWQEPWLAGTSSGAGSFTGTAPKLTLGFHTLYAFATDGEEATSTNTGYGTSPLTGNITAYSFLVPAPEASFSPGSGTFSAGIPVDTATPPQKTVTLTNAGSYALTVASVALSGTNPGDYAESDNCVASSPIAAQGTCTINVTFTPQAVGARLATLVVTDDSGDKNGTQHEVSLTGTAVTATATTTVTPSANPSVFGQSVTFTATVTPSTPVVPTGTVTFKDGTTTICNAVALTSGEATCTISTLTAGLHSITAVYSGDTNFVGSTSAVLSQTVSYAVLTITASSSITAYGTAIPAVTPSYSGFINGDTPANLTTQPTCTTTGVPASHPVGTYTGANTCSGAVDSKYTITYVPGNVQITTVALTITASSGSFTYGGTVPTITPSYSGFVNGDTAASLSTRPTCSTTATSSSLVAGSPYASTCSGAVDGNYTIQYVKGSVTESTAALTITASNGTFVYGGTVPAITPGYIGFVAGDTAASLSTRPTCSTTAASSSPVAGSPYASTCSGAVDGNYTIQYVKGSVTESAAALTITASSGTFTYGGTVPAVTPGYTGLVNGDTAASLTTAPTCSTTATSSSPVSGGPYPSTCAGAVDGNYTIQYVKGSVTESAAALTITASSGTFPYGGTVPAITPGYSGFVNGDTAASLTTPPTCSTTATSSSPVTSGPYPSTCAGAVGNNYAITYVNGAVTESAAPTTTAITGITPNPSMAGQPVTVSYTVTVSAPGSGTVPGTDKVTVTDSTGASCQGTVAASNCALVPTAVGPDLITATYSGDSNFSTSKASGSVSFSIVPSISLTGLTPTNPPTQSTSVGVALNSPTPTPLTGTLTLSFQSTAAGTPANYIDPATQFAAGGTTLNFTIPAGSAVATLPQSGAIQQGTTAGTITVTLTSLVSGTTTIALPQPTPSLSVVVTPMAPVITSGSGTITSLTSTGFNVELDAYSTPRDLANATFTFQATSGDQLNGATPSPVSLSGVAPAWFSSSSGLQSGGLFHLTVPFTFSGNTSALGSVTVTLSNSVGTSSPVTVAF